MAGVRAHGNGGRNVVEWQGSTLIGPGDATACARYVQRLIPHPKHVAPHCDNDVGAASTPDFNDIKSSSSKVVGGIKHPPVGTGSHFLAMSLYFFPLDALRLLTGHAAVNAAWPTPSIAELADALPLLCGQDWQSELLVR